MGITIASLPALKRLFSLPKGIKSLFSRSRTRTRSSTQAFRPIHERDEALQVKGSNSKKRVEDVEQAIALGDSNVPRTSDVTVVAPEQDREVPHGGTFHVSSNHSSTMAGST